LSHRARSCARWEPYPAPPTTRRPWCSRIALSILVRPWRGFGGNRRPAGAAGLEPDGRGVHCVSQRVLSWEHPAVLVACGRREPYPMPPVARGQEFSRIALSILVRPERGLGGDWREAGDAVLESHDDAHVTRVEGEHSRRARPAWLSRSRSPASLVCTGCVHTVRAGRPCSRSLGQDLWSLVAGPVPETRENESAGGRLGDGDARAFHHEDHDGHQGVMSRGGPLEPAPRGCPGFFVLSVDFVVQSCGIGGRPERRALRAITRRTGEC